MYNDALYRSRFNYHFYIGQRPIFNHGFLAKSHPVGHYFIAFILVKWGIAQWGIPPMK